MLLLLRLRFTLLCLLLLRRLCGAARRGGRRRALTDQRQLRPCGRVSRGSCLAPRCFGFRRRQDHRRVRGLRQLHAIHNDHLRLRLRLRRQQRRHWHRFGSRGGTVAVERRRLALLSSMLLLHAPRAVRVSASIDAADTQAMLVLRVELRDFGFDLRRQMRVLSHHDEVSVRASRQELRLLLRHHQQIGR